MQGLIISIFAASTIVISAIKGNYLLVELESAEGIERNLNRMRAYPRNMDSHFEKSANGTTTIVPLVETTFIMNDNRKYDESHEETTTVRNRQGNTNIKY